MTSPHYTGMSRPALLTAVLLLAACGSEDQKSAGDPGGATARSSYKAEPARAPTVGDTVVATRPVGYNDGPDPARVYVSARVEAIEGDQARVTWFTNDPGHVDLIADLADGYPRTAPLNELYPIHPAGAGPEVKPGDPVLFNRPHENTAWTLAKVARIDGPKLVLTVDGGEMPIDPSSVVKINQTTVDRLALQELAHSIFRSGIYRWPVASEGYAAKANDLGLLKSGPSWGEATVFAVKAGRPDSYSWVDFRAESVYAKEFGPRTFAPLPQVTSQAVEVGRYVLVPLPPPDDTHFWTYARVEEVDGARITVLDDKRLTRTLDRAQVVLLERDVDSELAAAIDKK